MCIRDRLESSPVDRHKAAYGEKDQASYLIMAKEASASKSRSTKQEEEIKEAAYSASPTKQSQPSKKQNVGN